MSRPPSRHASDSSTQAVQESAAVAEDDMAGAGQPQPNARAASRPTYIPLGLTQSTVSIFTGASSIGVSSSSSTKSRPPDAADETMSPGSINRVFPIRSAVSIDPSATPMVPAPEASSGFPGFDSPPQARSNKGRRSSIASPLHGPATKPDRDLASSEFRLPSTGALPQSTDSHYKSRPLAPQGFSINTADTLSLRSDDASSVSGAPSVHSLSEPQLVTARFKHVMTDGGHAVITGRDGDTLQRCEDEPIHIPGAIQSFGLLIAFREENDKLVVRVVSENSLQIIGYSPKRLFSLSSFLDIFSDEQADNLMDHLEFIRDEDTGDVEVNGPEVFMLAIKPPGQRTRKLWCAMHICQRDPSLVICEFEIEDDRVNPLVSPSDRQTPEVPEDTLGSKPTHDELIDSTVNVSRPLRVLRSARKKRTETAAMEVFNIMSQVQEQLSNAPTLTLFLKVLVGIVKELTGFHRVMIYQFDQSWNGRVVAELVDPRATTDLYKGLNFPASDIPKQARDLYKLNKVRLLYDREQETARLVCRTTEDLENPLDLTHANLRAMSPIHLKYLANMAVRSSMSISINAFDELWGLIACHTYGARGTRVSFPIRKMCRLVGDTASRNIERLSYASRLQARKLINTTSSTANPSGYIVASSDDLLKLFSADVGALSIRDETKILGNPRGHLPEILAMVEFLRMRAMTSVFSSHDISIDFPDLRYGPGLQFVAGVLFVPLSTGGNDFIAFFRKGVLQEVKWAGNPYEKFIKEGTEGYLEPRTSFRAWNETIVGRCRDWTDDEMETAAVLCLVYGKFIDVWRQKEAALQTSQLTRLLLANSAHEVRTPLNAIINYLEIAMEGSLDQETRDHLSKSHSASKSLVYVINDLLDLTKAEGGQSLVKDEPFDLVQSLKDATEPFKGESRRKNLAYNIMLSPELPQQVIGDHRRVRQIVSNLIANAFQYTSEGQVVVEAKVAPPLQAPGRTEVEIIVEDTGKGMASAKVDALFRELEEVSYDEDLSKHKLISSDPSQPQEGGEQMLGLGLAVVARTVRHMNGQLRLKTEEDKGSCFTIILSFDTNIAGRPQVNHHGSDTPQRSTHTRAISSEGAVTLVYRALQTPHAPTQAPPIARKPSGESITSFKSAKSMTSMQSDASRRSDAERLINAIQEPLRLAGDNLSDDPADFESKEQSNSVPIHTSSVPSTPNRERTPSVVKTRSLPSPQSLKSPMQNVFGSKEIADSGTPLRPVRIPDDDSIIPTGSESGPKVTFSEEPETISAPSETTETDRASTSDALSILVAEDDPINCRIMKKRLGKLGHSVHLTVNGEECSSAHGEQPANFDAILMDLQMPIVDGFSSTKMIRSYEKTHIATCLSTRARMNGRIPIFAVSASLVEAERQKYIDTGFDGWIMKPVDFKRVEMILDGIVKQESRAACLYQSGKWETGGWFSSKAGQTDLYDINTRPSLDSPTSTTKERDI